MTGPRYPQQQWPPPAPIGRRRRGFGTVLAIVVGVLVLVAGGVTVHLVASDGSGLEDHDDPEKRLHSDVRGTGPGRCPAAQ